ncbi:MAG: aldo/keto reductase [Bacteroidetes bacterium]|nr:MAG: aldo/keto reductase [Bacteroidota bacterium]
MNYRPIGTSDLRVSEISLGCMSLGTEAASFERMVQQALDLGINYFDTADLYDKGLNERLLGQALKGRRQQVVISTKVGNQWRPDGSGWDWNPSKAYILQAVKQSLQRLQTDYIDLYMLHGGTLEDPIEETIEAFESLKQAGHIRYYGISSIRPNVIRQWVKHSRMVSVMMQYSLLDRRPEESCLDLLHSRQVSVLSRGTVAKGLLAGKPPKAYLGYSAEEVARVQHRLHELAGPGRSPAHLAIQYVLKHPAVASAVLGASKPAQVAENAAASTSSGLSAEEWQLLHGLLPPKVYEQHR